MIIKWSIHSEHLNTYNEKFVWKHLNFIHSVETAFCLMFKNFSTMRQKFFMLCNFWWKNHKMHNINIKRWFLSKLFCKTILQTIFSISSKIQWITNYITLKHTSRLYKSQIKVCMHSLHILTLLRHSYHSIMKNN